MPEVLVKLTPDEQRKVVKVIDQMVTLGKLEHCIINGKPGVRLVKEKT